MNIMEINIMHEQYLIKRSENWGWKTKNPPNVTLIRTQGITSNNIAVQPVYTSKKCNQGNHLTNNLRMQSQRNTRKAM